MPHLRIFLVLTLALFSSYGFSQTEADEVRVIVSYKNKRLMSSNLPSPPNLKHHKIMHSQPLAGNSMVFTLSKTKQTPLANCSESSDNEALLAQFRSLPDVKYAVIDRKGHFVPLPSIEAPRGASPRLSHEAQWDAFKRPGGIMLESSPFLYDGAWLYTTGQSTPNIVIAVLDTGIAEHSDLMPSLLKDGNGEPWGWNFSGNNRDLKDETGSYHGTHVAGTIASHGAEIKGVGENLKLLTLKIPDQSSMFYESAVINAIRWAVGDSIPGIPDNPYPAKVLNMSFGVDEMPGKEMDHCDAALQEAIDFARQRGAVLVAAAGNNGSYEAYKAPAVCPGVIKVAATGPHGTRAYYSNFGPGVTLAAPGGDLSSGQAEDGILSTVNPGGGYLSSGYHFYQGTSMASPHVAGVAGLIFSLFKGEIPPDSVEKILYTTTHLFGETQATNKACIDEAFSCGHGLLDAEQAVLASLADYDIWLVSPSDVSKNGFPELFSQSESYWTRIHSNDLPPQFPSVFKNETGTIYAHTPRGVYQLDQSSFSECDIIGFDGVGCRM